MFPIGLLPHLDGLYTETVVIQDNVAVLIVAARQPTAPCPSCGCPSDRYHSSYQRSLADLPIGSTRLALRVRVRRFRCPKRTCPRRIFAERFPSLGRVRARRTHTQQAALEAVGHALGGSAGARLAKRMGLPASRSTILRLVSATPEPASPTPRVLGVDDWARRRGQTYGTILVDLERHRPVDLLPDRTAEALAGWLKTHPGVEVIARDRAGAYAEGARQGAPGAIQVADRYHLLANVGEALERVLARRHSSLKEAAAAVDRLTTPVTETEVGAGATVDAEDTAAGTPSAQAPGSAVSSAVAGLTRQAQLKQAHRARRLERYEQVVSLHQQGFSLRGIGRELGIGKHTVARFLNAGQFPERAERRARLTMLTPYEGYLRQRWSAGCHNARTLFEEIKLQGFAGSASLVRQFVARWRPSPGRSGPTPRRAKADRDSATPPVRQPTRVLSARQARWLLLRDAGDLSPEELLYREQLLQADEELRAARTLAEQFGRIVRQRDRPALTAWLEEARSSSVGEFRQFALMLRRDLPAVEAALTYEWSNGQTEGQINRLKLLKRQMFGRAALPLLRRRFLPAA